MSDQGLKILRIVDANLNRIGEGLRLLEDVARFLLDDPVLSKQLKTMRHELLPGNRALRKELLEARRAKGDVGAFAGLADEGERADVAALITANARRAQEAARVLEELAKLPNETFGLKWMRFKQARFTLYDLERKLISRLHRQEKRDRIRGLYMILDTDALGGRSEVEVTRQTIQGGARAIQLRDKHHDEGELLPIARELKAICADAGVLFIVNDYLGLALASDADGIHLGQSDLPLSLARKVLPLDRIVGCSTHSKDEALRAEADGADYIAVGAIHETPSKPGTRHCGLKTLEEIRKAVSVPIVAIGGIAEENVDAVIGAGADGVAVISALLSAEDVRAAAQRLTTKLEKLLGGRDEWKGQPQG